MTSDKANELAIAIADYFFERTPLGLRVDRLVAMPSNEEHLGGWGRSEFVAQIATIIAKHAEPAEPTATTTQQAMSNQVGGSHYVNMPIQPVEFIHKNGIGFIEGCAIKYLCRWRVKNGVDDLRKAKHFIALLIEFAAWESERAIEREKGSVE